MRPSGRLRRPLSAPPGPPCPGRGPGGAPRSPSSGPRRGRCPAPGPPPVPAPAGQRPGPRVERGLPPAAATARAGPAPGARGTGPLGDDGGARAARVVFLNKRPHRAPPAPRRHGTPQRDPAREGTPRCVSGLRLGTRSIAGLTSAVPRLLQRDRRWRHLPGRLGAVSAPCQLRHGALPEQAGSDEEGPAPKGQSGHSV